MKKVIGFTDSVTTCECCGKSELKGTYCIDLDGVELYYGSVCAFENHGLTTDEQKELKSTFAKEQKNEKLYVKHIQPIKDRLKIRIESTFVTTVYDDLTETSKKIYNEFVDFCNEQINITANKYKITL